MFSNWRGLFDRRPIPCETSCDKIFLGRLQLPVFNFQSGQSVRIGPHDQAQSLGLHLYFGRRQRDTTILWMGFFP